MDRGAWWATVCGGAQSWTQVNMHVSTHACPHLQLRPDPQGPRAGGAGTPPAFRPMNPLRGPTDLRGAKGAQKTALLTQRTQRYRCSTCVSPATSDPLSVSKTHPVSPQKLPVS